MPCCSRVVRSSTSTHRLTESLHIQLTSAIAINSAGQILVEGNAYDNYQSAYLLTPAGMPEADTA